MPAPVPADQPFAALEEAYGALLARFGALMVARTLGTLDEDGLARRYADQRSALAHLHAVVDPLSLGASDRLALQALVDGLAVLDEAERPPDCGVEVPSVEAPDVAALRDAVVKAFGEAAAAVPVEGEWIQRLDALTRLATLEDPSARRRVFAALAALERTVDGDGGADSPYRRLLRSSAARWARDGSPAAADAAALGLDPDRLEPMLRQLAEGFRGLLGPEPIEPWDLRYAAGGLERRLGPQVSVDRAQEVVERHLRALGADPALIRFDTRPRPGRRVVPVAFTDLERPPRRRPDGSWEPGRPYVFGTYTAGGLGELGELLHESGHAVHMAAIRARPSCVVLGASATGFYELIADALAWDVHEPAFQERYLGAAAPLRDGLLDRYGAVALDACWGLFEIELHRHPERRPNDVWTELTSELLGVVPHPERSWWAVRTQLIGSPGYMPSYPLGAIGAAAVRARVRELIGESAAGNPGWYPLLAERLFRFGAERPVVEVLEELLGGPLTIEPLLADLARAG